MSREPRLSALSLLKNFPRHQCVIQKQFSKQELQYYQQLLLQPVTLLTSSMGRFLDGIAAILGILACNTYEGEAAMQLEALAATCLSKPTGYYPIFLANGRLHWNEFLMALLEDLHQKEEPASIAWKVFFSLAKLVEKLSDHFHIEKVAFSGGVFQNALLIDLLVEQVGEKRKLYFHQQLSPNDECIGFGQIACFNMLKAKQKDAAKTKAKKMDTIISMSR